MWLILSLKYKFLLGVYNNRRTAVVAVNALKKLDNKRFADQQIVVHYILVEEFQKYIEPIFSTIGGDYNVTNN